MSRLVLIALLAVAWFALTGCTDQIADENVNDTVIVVDEDSMDDDDMEDAVDPSEDPALLDLEAGLEDEDVNPDADIDADADLDSDADTETDTEVDSDEEDLLVEDIAVDADADLEVEADADAELVE